MDFSVFLDSVMPLLDKLNENDTFSIVTDVDDLQSGNILKREYNSGNETSDRRACQYSDV